MAELLPLPKILFDFGAIQSLGAELTALNIKRPLVLTDRGLVEHGIFKKVTDAIPSKVTELQVEPDDAPKSRACLQNVSAIRFNRYG